MISLIRIWAVAGATPTASATSRHGAMPRRRQESNRGGGPDREGLLPARECVVQRDPKRILSGSAREQLAEDLAARGPKTELVTAKQPGTLRPHAATRRATRTESRAVACRGASAKAPTGLALPEVRCAPRQQEPLALVRAVHARGALCLVRHAGPGPGQEVRPNPPLAR